MFGLGINLVSYFTLAAAIPVDKGLPGYGRMMKRGLGKLEGK